ncbi:MtrAB system histidine kinase MtrB [Micromonospora sp. WMMD1128]|uniref:MtrAB system histidine kinase MtrB n=1 Tax=unclassified Micromonospora TaxID=2617518 RepID=UPI00248B8DC5|nr:MULTISPECIES: MtrAB system histidine kinase MtrB [unclassified Micromonospora]WBB72699.1 MtrAB system histidine kinase MtrB [Micromonospora sp. WMMD1128]WFE33869.1 MtrAB system histidine kinase MtrB [Micromonospora sp. WMMD975]
MVTAPLPDPPTAESRRLPAARALWRALAGRSTRFAAGVRLAWRRSLQVRVVTITLVASSLLVGGFAYLIADKITNILLENAETDVRLRLNNGSDYAAKQFNLYSQPQEAQLQDTIDGTVNYLAGGDPAQTSGVVVAITADNFTAFIEPRVSPDVPVRQVIGDELRATVASGKVAHQIRTGTLNDDRTKYLVYGSPVPTKFGQVELYYLVPLARQDATAADARATVVATGVALVLLLGLLAALVTRLVVTPVRVAARTAQRLSAGLLDQRMVVSGEDDLALLAASFNQMATNLQRQILRLEEMSRLQRRFTSDVSHELRTPLTTVRMAADLIFAERDEFDPAVARSAELLQAELDRFEELLTDLLEISRFDAGFAVLDSEPTDLVPVVHRVTERLSGLAERVGVAIELDLPGTPVIAEVDPRRVERVLRNLVGNAVEHGEAKPVRISLGMDQSAVAITVRDHGVGLKPGEEKLVFNRFWRADPSRARQTGGTGLGLSISLEDARLHGGWLEAWGAPGQGAQFRLTLPARAGDRLTTSPLRLVPADAALPFGRPRAGGPLAIGPGSGAGALAIGPADGPERVEVGP